MLPQIDVTLIRSQSKRDSCRELAANLSMSLQVIHVQVSTQTLYNLNDSFSDGSLVKPLPSMLRQSPEGVGQQWVPIYLPRTRSPETTRSFRVWLE